MKTIILYISSALFILTGIFHIVIYADLLKNTEQVMSIIFSLFLLLFIVWILPLKILIAKSKSKSKHDRHLIYKSTIFAPSAFYASNILLLYSSFFMVCFFYNIIAKNMNNREVDKENWLLLFKFATGYEMFLLLLGIAIILSSIKEDKMSNKIAAPNREDRGGRP